MSADPTHAHDEFHRGQVPEDQLATGTPTAGYVATATGAGSATWSPAGGSSTGWPTVYTYDDTSTTDADPGIFKYRLDDADPALATKFIVSDIAATGDDLSAWIASWAAEGGALLGYLRLRSVSAPGAFATYHVTAITDHSGYATITVDVVGNDGVFSTTAGDTAIDFWPTPP